MLKISINNREFDVEETAKEVREFVKGTIMPIASTFPKEHITVKKDFNGNTFKYTIFNDYYYGMGADSLLFCEAENKDDEICGLITLWSQGIYDGLIGKIAKRAKRNKCNRVSTVA